MKKILTHAGTFHADEISAIALLLKFFPGTPVERTHDIAAIKAAQADPEILVLDIGREYDPAQLNFDHHQDEALPASNMLVLNYFIKNGAIQPRQAELLEKYFFGYISQVDCGVVVEKAGAIPSISGTIRACNNLPEITAAFETALSIMRAALDAQMATVNRRIQSEPIWAAAQRAQDKRIVIHDSPEHIVGWHELAEEEGVVFLVTPNARGGYQVTSRDSALFPIPPHHSQTFRHNSGFLAAYPDRETAITGAYRALGLREYETHGFSAGKMSGWFESPEAAKEKFLDWDYQYAAGNVPDVGEIIDITADNF